MKFVQGGSYELSKNKSILEKRIALATSNSELRTEILQDTIVRILNGEGSCETIDLKRTKTHKMYYGAFGQQGSDSVTMQILNGQRYEKFSKK